MANFQRIFGDDGLPYRIDTSGEGVNESYSPWSMGNDDLELRSEPPAFSRSIDMDFGYGQDMARFREFQPSHSEPVGVISDPGELAKSDFLRTEKAGYQDGDFDRRYVSKDGDTMTALFRREYGYKPSANELIQYANLNGMSSPHQLSLNRVITSPDIGRLHQTQVSKDQVNDYWKKNDVFNERKRMAVRDDPLTSWAHIDGTQAERDADPKYVTAKTAQKTSNPLWLAGAGRQINMSGNLSKNEQYFPLYLSNDSDSDVVGRTQTVQSGDSWRPQTAGQGMVGLWDTLQRDQYKNAINLNASKAVELINAARLTDDIKAANAAAYNASDARGTIRQATREKLSWGGAKLSDMIDKSLPPEEYFNKYRPKYSNPFDLAKVVAEKSGSSRESLKYLQMFGKVAAPAATGFGLYNAGRNVYDAPPELKGQVAAAETGGILGGAGGSTLGAGLGVLGLGALAATPPGWVAIGAGLVGGGIGGYFGSEGGKELGGKIYKWIKN